MNRPDIHKRNGTMRPLNNAKKNPPRIRKDVGEPTTTEN